MASRSDATRFPPPSPARSSRPPQRRPLHRPKRDSKMLTSCGNRPVMHHPPHMSAPHHVRPQQVPATPQPDSTSAAMALLIALATIRIARASS